MLTPVGVRRRNHPDGRGPARPSSSAVSAIVELRKRSVYAHAGFLLEVYRDRTVLGERIGDAVTLTPYALTDIQALGFLARGSLVLQLADRMSAAYALGPAAEVCNLVTGLLAIGHAAPQRRCALVARVCWRTRECGITGEGNAVTLGGPMPNENRILYAYRRNNVTLEVYSDRIEVHDQLFLVHRKLVCPFAKVRAVRCLRTGLLRIELVGNARVDYQLGPGVGDVCALVAGLL